MGMEKEEGIFVHSGLVFNPNGGSRVLMHVIYYALPFTKALPVVSFSTSQRDGTKYTSVEHIFTQQLL